MRLFLSISFAVFTGSIAQAQELGTLSTRADIPVEPAFNLRTNAVSAAAGLVNFDLIFPIAGHWTVGPTYHQYKLRRDGGYTWGSIDRTWNSEVDARAYGIKLTYHFRLWERSGSCISLAHRWFPGHLTGNVAGQPVRGDFNGRVFALGYFFQWRRPSGLNFAFGGGLERFVGFPETMGTGTREVDVPNGLAGLNPYVDVSIGWMI